MTSTAAMPLVLPKYGMPVTIITGFLGSGKTTLLNQILSDRQDLKIAVLVNEFGDINIDSQLLVSIDEDMMELSNGCICCTINDGLVDAVYRVLERDDRIDHMVIETTGLADPLPIILTFLGTELRDLTQLDSVVTMVDAETFTSDHFESEAAHKQLTYADITILNKTDLANPDQIQTLETYIRTVKPGARILQSQYGNVPLPLILGMGYNQVEDYADLIESPDSVEHHHDEHHHDEHHHDEHHHGHHHHSSHLDNDGYGTVAFESDRPFDVKRFETFLQMEMPPEVFRAKGILWFSESELRHVFQLSGIRFDIQGDQWRTAPKSQLIFIGRGLDGDAIRQNLNLCLV
jgi:G3E family GTPase